MRPLVREPGAANPHARFDERGVETGQGELLRHWQTKGPDDTHGFTYTTAPLLESTFFFPKAGLGLD